MPAYIAYGLRIGSELPLPDLVPVTGVEKPDVSIRRGAVKIPPECIDGEETCLWARPEEVCLHYRGAASLLIQRGGEIIVDLRDGVSPGALRLILQGPALGIILHQRGFLVLHASAVRIGEGAVAFLGDKGAGKSTTAAAFNSRGHALVADDVVAVSPGTFLVYPAFPLLKLWGEAAEHVHGPTEGLERFYPDMEKFAVPASDRFAQTPSRLIRAFVLQDGDRESIEKLSPQQAFMELVKNSYLLNLLRSTNTAVSHFHQAVALASAAPVCKLVRRRSLAALDEMVSAVVADVA